MFANLLIDFNSISTCARQLKKNKLWNMRMTVIPMVVGAIGTVPKDIEKRLEIREKTETTQNTAQLKSD